MRPTLLGEEEEEEENENSISFSITQSDNFNTKKFKRNHFKLNSRNSNLKSFIDKPEMFWFTPKYFSIRNQKFLRDNSFQLSWAQAMN
jgi:hypothetical protein